MVYNLNEEERSFKMSKLMDWLCEEMKKIPESEIVTPDNEVGEGEKVLGVLEDVEVRKIYELRSRLNIELSQKMDEIPLLLRGSIKAGAEHDSETCKGCILGREISFLRMRMVLVELLLSTCLLEELSQEAVIELVKKKKEDIGIREGWKIVIPVDEDEGMPEEMLMSIFRGLPPFPIRI